MSSHRDLSAVCAVSPSRPVHRLCCITIPTCPPSVLYHHPDLSAVCAVSQSSRCASSCHRGAVSRLLSCADALHRAPQELKEVGKDFYSQMTTDSHYVGEDYDVFGAWLGADKETED